MPDLPAIYTSTDGRPEHLRKRRLRSFLFCGAFQLLSLIHIYSGVMGYRTPAKFVDLDIRGASKIRLQMDRVDNNSADHANWADAKFLKYDEIPEETGVKMCIRDRVCTLEYCWYWR